MKTTILTPIQKFTDGKNVIAIICYQWGDTGKGKFVFLLASDWADIVIRGTGGANAGHTIFHNDQEFICHLLPSGIINPKVINVIGRGVALDLHSLIGEMKNTGLAFDNLRIANEANLLMPYHILEDITSPKSKLIGTTGCGIGPFYADYYSRLYISMNDLMNEEIFIRKLNDFMDAKQEQFNALDKELVKDLMSGKKYGHKFNHGRLYDEKTVLNRQAIIDYYLNYLAPKFRPRVINLNSFVEDALRNQKKILLEGAQGTLLSIDYGTTLYQTSSDCTVEGLAKGCGLKVSEIDQVLGIVKAPFMTRVGNGPFPTEFGGEESEAYCANSLENNAASEKALDLNISEAINGKDELIQGIAVRLKGGEYGKTTARPRRTGWLDLIALKHAIKVNGSSDLVLTKVDVMSGVEEIKLCVGYDYRGPNIFYGDGTLYSGESITEFIRDSEILRHCKPIYKSFPGWKEDISKIRTVEELPRELTDIIEFIEEFSGGIINILSVGPGNDDTIFLVQSYQ